MDSLYIFTPEDKFEELLKEIKKMQKNHKSIKTQERVIDSNLNLSMFGTEKQKQAREVVIRYCLNPTDSPLTLIKLFKKLGL
jgi:hypothetical protein